MAFYKKFDAVWSQLSLIHIPYEETRSVYTKIHRALKDGGIFFASYKYGDKSMLTSDRNFYNMDEKIILPYMRDLFDLLEVWKVEDARSKISPSKDASLLNFVAKKIIG